MELALWLKAASNVNLLIACNLLLLFPLAQKPSESSQKYRKCPSIVVEDLRVTSLSSFKIKLKILLVVTLRTLL